MTSWNRGSRVNKRSSRLPEHYSLNTQLALSHNPVGESHTYMYDEHHYYNLHSPTYQAIQQQQQASSPDYSQSTFASDSSWQLNAQQLIPADLPQQVHHIQQQQVLVHDYQCTHSQPIQSPPSVPTPRFTAIPSVYEDSDDDRQESKNDSTMESEAIEPPIEGFPNVLEFDVLMSSYVSDLSVKKQDKALIHARRARNIRQVLLDQKDTSIESAQFRFWVKKMFKLEPHPNSSDPRKFLVCHEGKPVAVREKLFKILTHAHQECQHGGRDKTSGQVRRKYSWVPKELISRFVKICPTCQVRRGGSSRMTPPRSTQNSPQPCDDQSVSSPAMISPPESRRESMVQRHPRMTTQVHSPSRNGVRRHSQQQQYRRVYENSQQHRLPTQTESGGLGVNVLIPIASFSPPSPMVHHGMPIMSLHHEMDTQTRIDDILTTADLQAYEREFGHHHAATYDGSHHF